MLTIAPALLVGLALAAALLPAPAAWIEQFYSRGAYLLAQNVITRVSGLVGFAWLDVLIAAALAGAGFWGWRAFSRTRRGAVPGGPTPEPARPTEGARPSPGGPPGEPHRSKQADRPPRRGSAALARTAARQALLAAAWAAALYLVFLALWGLNYRRAPLRAQLDFAPQRVAPAAVAALAGEAVERVNRLYAPPAERPRPALAALPERLAPAFERAQRRLGARRTAVAGRPKATLLSAYFRRAGIDGMINPFALEVLVNRDILPHERPFVLAHEWAHLAGWADESEASFVGWLTCLAGDDHSRYSGWMFLLRRLLVHVPAEERAALWRDLDAGPLEDYRAVSARIGAANPVVSRGARRVYDRYLRANRVAAGIASYGLVVELVLGTDGTPLWRGLAPAPAPASRRGGA